MEITHTHPHFPDKTGCTELLADRYRSCPACIRADRLVDAFAESEDMDSGYLQRALRRLEEERKAILDHRKRERSRPDLPDKLDFPGLAFEEKKLVAAQFIEKMNVGENAAEVVWRV